MINAFVVIVKVETEGEAPTGAELVRLGMEKLRSTEDYETQLSLDRKFTVKLLWDVPEFSSIDVLPDEKARYLWYSCAQFIDEQEISCAASVSQRDNIIENAYGFIEEICDIVGYYNEEDCDPIEKDVPK